MVVWRFLAPLTSGVYFARGLVKFKQELLRTLTAREGGWPTAPGRPPGRREGGCRELLEAHQTLGCAPQIPRPQPCGDVLVLAEEEASTDGSRRSAAEEDNSVQTRIHLEGQEGPENPEGAERGQKLRKEIQKNVPAGR